MAKLHRAGFAAFALILASLGIYAVISYSVTQRVQEIGIRMALGASATDLQTGILFRTLGLAALGLAMGMAASRALTRALESFLFGVAPSDPVTFIGIASLLMAVAAGWLLSNTQSFANRSYVRIALQLRRCASSPAAFQTNHLCAQIKMRFYRPANFSGISAKT